MVDLHSKILDARPPPPPGGPNSFNFMQFFGKIWQNRMLAPPLESWRPPPRGNPGSATDMVAKISNIKKMKKLMAHLILKTSNLFVIHDSRWNCYLKSSESFSFWNVILEHNIKISHFHWKQKAQFSWKVGIHFEAILRKYKRSISWNIHKQI